MRLFLSGSIFLLFTFSIFAQPEFGSTFLATYDDSTRGYLEVAGMNGERLQKGSIWQLILDRDSNGLSLPSMEEEYRGLPQDDDSLIFQGNSGDNLFVVDTISAIAAFVQIDTSIMNLPFYLRVFESDTLVEDIYYTQSYSHKTSIDSGYLSLLLFQLASVNNGVIMEFNLNENRLPDLLIDSELESNNTIDSLILPDGSWASFEGFGGHDIPYARFMRYSFEPPEWHMSGAALSRHYVLSQDYYGVEGGFYRHKFDFPFNENEINERYNGEYNSENMAIYRQTEKEWVELNTTVVINNQCWAIISSTEGPLYGRFALAPSGLLPVEEDSRNEMATDFHLYSVYPNPFNPSTRIRFYLKESRQVRISVINIIGEEVTQIIDGVLSQGDHEFTFLAEGIASGVYFIRMEAGNYKSIKKMILLR